MACVFGECFLFVPERIWMIGCIILQNEFKESGNPSAMSYASSPRGLGCSKKASTSSAGRAESPPRRGFPGPSRSFVTHSDPPIEFPTKPQTTQNALRVQARSYHALGCAAFPETKMSLQPAPPQAHNTAAGSRVDKIRLWGSHF